MAHNIQDFAQQGLNTGLPSALQPRRPQGPPQGFAPQQANFGGQLQPPVQQQISQSQILGALLSGELGGIPQDQGNAFGGLQNAILQRGTQDALLRQQQQQQVGNQVAGGFLQNQPRPPGVQLGGGF